MYININIDYLHLVSHIQVCSLFIHLKCNRKTFHGYIDIHIDHCLLSSDQRSVIFDPLTVLYIDTLDSIHNIVHTQYSLNFVIFCCLHEYY